MSRVWFLADTHFGVKNDNDMWLDDFTNYFNDVVIPLMKREYRDGDILVHLGDVFDNRSTIGLKTICNTINIFTKISKIFKDIRIIVGNHDILNKSTNEITSIRIIERIPNIKVYFSPVVEEIEGQSVLFNPWVNDIEEENRLLSSVDVDYIFGHLDVNGCLMNAKGVRSMGANSIDSKNFKKSVVYAGHIHKKQDYKNVHYVGSPYQKDRGDIGNENGITILDMKTGKTIFYENTYSPRFKSFSIYEILDKTVGELKEEWKNCFVELHVKSEDKLKCNFNSLIEELSGVYREFSTPQDNTGAMVESMLVDMVEGERKTTEEHVKDWLKDNDINGKKYDTILDIFKKYKEKYENCCNK